MNRPVVTEPRPVRPPVLPTGEDSKATLALTAGLLSDHAHIPAKYLYDLLGSRLFEAITLLPEYYPTATERDILAGCVPQVAAQLGPGPCFVDLGAGNCAKARALLPCLQPAHYIAIDIAGDFLRESVDALARRFPHVRMRALVQDFSAGLRLPDDIPRRNRLFFYPGSSLGNFAPGAAETLLAGLRSQCGDDGALLLGVDLVKDPAILQAAYDDALGLTAAFNLNVLRHVNRLLGADFDPAVWRHHARFDAGRACMEMHLVARCGTEVHWAGHARRFRPGERIHTESSHKYTCAGIGRMLLAAGFSSVRTWVDDRQWFAVCLAQARPGGLH